MRSTVALEAKEKSRKRNNAIGTSFMTSMLRSRFPVKFAFSRSRDAKSL